MSIQILKHIVGIETFLSGNMIDRLRKPCKRMTSKRFCSAMKDFFVLIPHTVIINLEKFYHGIFFTITKLIGAKITIEDATNVGFIDAVLQGKNNTYIIEFKKDKTPDKALAQIENKKYFENSRLKTPNQLYLLA